MKGLEKSIANRLPGNWCEPKANQSFQIEANGVIKILTCSILFVSVD